MFGKLVKHEFRATRRVIPFVFLLTVFLVLMMTVSVVLDLDTMVGLTLVLLIITMFAEVIITYVLVVWRFYKSMCGNEAYLSFTLPIKPQLLLWSKLLVSFVWVALSYLVFAGSIMMAVVIIAKGTGTSIQDIFEQIKIFLNMIGFGGHETAAIATIIGLFTLAILSGLTQIFFSVSLGSTSKLHKFGVGGPILVYVILYFALQFVTVIAMSVIPLAIEMDVAESGALSYRIVSRNMVQWFLEAIRNSEAGSNEGLIGLGSFLVIPLIIAALLFATSRIADKHTSVR